MATIITMMSDFYDSPGVTFTYMKNINLYSFTVENIFYWFASIFSEKESLYSAGALKSENLGGISRIL